MIKKERKIRIKSSETQKYKEMIKRKKNKIFFNKREINWKK